MVIIILIDVALLSYEIKTFGKVRYLFIEPIITSERTQVRSKKQGKDMPPFPVAKHFSLHYAFGAVMFISQ